MKLNYKKTFILGFGFLSIMLCATLYDAFIPVFLRKFIDKNWLIGFLMTIDNYVSLFLQPLVGRLSDRTNTKFGKRMPYILIGMPLSALMVSLIPNHWSFISLVFIIVLYNLIMAAYRSPTVALMPDITPSQHQSKANGVINFMGGIGAAIALFVGSSLYDVNPEYPFYMAAAILLFSMAVLFFKIKEKRDALEYEASDSDSAHTGIKTFINNPGQIFSAVKSMKYVLLLLCSTFFLYSAFNSVSSFFTLFSIDYLHISGSIAIGKFAYLAALMVIFALPAGFIGAKLGKKKTIIIGIIIMILVFGSINFTKDINVIGYLFIPAGIAWALVMINTYPFVVSMTDAKNVGAYTGLYYLFSSLAAIASPPLIGFLIDTVGYSVLFKYSVAGFILALVFILFVRTPKEETPETVQSS